MVLTHTAVQASAWATSRRLAVDPARHRWLACLPLNHVGGLSVVTRSLLTGTPLMVLPGFDRDAVRAPVRSRGAGVPRGHGLAARRRGALSHRGARRRPAPTALPPNVVTTYGLTETGSGVVYDGLPLDGVEVDIDAATAEIRLRGPMLLRAYRDGTVPLAEGGWFATGDAGWLDAGGRLHVAGRLAELIITGGENVWPAPVEAVLQAHPGGGGGGGGGLARRGVGPAGRGLGRSRRPGRPAHPVRFAGPGRRPAGALRRPPPARPVERLPRTAIGKVRRDCLPEPGPPP